MLDTPDADAALGADASRQVAAQDGIVPDEKLALYLQSLGEKLVRFAPRQPFTCQFQVVDQWSPNAFALPGGHIFVPRGLLVVTNSEDELACVVGHEITHAAARHAASRQAYSEQLSPFSLGLPRQANMAAYARDQERTADVGGQRICSAAGVIERLQMGASRIPTFLDTHPGTPERIGSAAVFASTLPPPPARDAVAARELYPTHFDALLLGADPSEGVVHGSRFLHPGLGIAISFPANWPVMNTPAAVVAISPKHDARFALEDAGPGDDPQAVAEPYLAAKVQEVRATIEFKGTQATRCCKSFVVRGQVETPQGVIAGQLSWIALGGRVYRLSAMYVPIVAEKYAGRAKQMVRSIAQLSARTGNVYEVHPTAIANALSLDARLSEGQLVKIGVREKYEPVQRVAAGAQ